MLLSLPKLQYAGVNTLLLHVNKRALFIQLSVSKITGAVSLFLSSVSNLIFSFLQTLFCQAGNRSFVVIARNANTAYAEQRPLFSLIQINKRRGMV